jgi:D-tyrosyl-tRNA(Tyr) deacylase
VLKVPAIVRAVVQRVTRAEARVDGEVVGEIGLGCCVLLGVAAADGDDDTALLARKVVGLRIFDDDAGRMNRALDEVGGALLVVSQFTLHADCRRGRRPSFAGAAAPERARRLYEGFVAQAAATVPVQTGRFGAHMALSLVNDGPVTILLDTAELA